ncbi:Stk1 family PASTA domain-containing Ser/Thr kinase [Microbacterium sp. SORGH_AS_0888]|uniref:Stk1 family PASTA domain-containing Ser/Thr kinase n=1 Tax=Microbacterium sp. SORGH_AS_0888 TaxID=3041791 RepID=UPI00278AA56D|nr:Stk1 family PASTA domain-containing Ser/Thr kinase [Microbacterium sp. SORGH_AS_0888]MDQ1129998.1 serine/threonine protein kinase [Microbacterium sp. SORGH_AS_0888]
MIDAARVLAGRYRVDELIGRGGMASVYRGYDTTLGRDVALKLLKRELADDATFRTRFRLEAQAASRMAHPAVVRVFDAGEDVETAPDGTDHPVPYIVMELVEGTLLKDLVADGPLPAADAVRYVDGILEALEYSHRAGVVHRDIKPGNVMVTAAGQVKVMDFGIARAVSDSSSTVAETTAILGTAAYFSPEQAKGEPVDGRADLYSTGVVLYELLTGRQPFRGDTPVAVAYQHVSEAPVPPSELVPELPKGLDPVVLRALAKDPFQRYQDAASFRSALETALTGKAPTKRQLGALTNELYGPNPRQAAETARTLRQLSTDSTMKRTQPGPPAAWIWAGVAVLAVLLVSVLFWVMSIRTGNEVASAARTVPDVTSMTYDRAVALLQQQGLSAERQDVTDDQIAVGNVVRTDPGAGTSVTAGQQVSVYVSSGKRTVAVPTLVGISQQNAQDALTKAGLTVGTITPVNDPQLAAGSVMSAEVAGSPVETGEALPLGTAINLRVASGKVVLADVTGYTVDAATRQLQSIGLTVTTAEDPQCKATPTPTVKVMSLAPGEVPIHSEITLTVCSG